MVQSMSNSNGAEVISAIPDYNKENEWIASCPNLKKQTNQKGPFTD